jgi:hypothetical protein
VPFKSYEELIAMASQDPKTARSKVAIAKKNNSPVVSPDNSGYEDDNPRKRAISKRLNRGENLSKASKQKFSSELIQNRMKKKYSPTPEDELVTKRKKVGYSG